MTFLNPLVLFGLVAAAIPVILHLLNLRKLRTIEFSTLSFLKELQQTKIRRLKIRQWLLLLVRTLIVLCLVFAFARPALRGALFGKLGANAHSSVAIIFDDSFSMTGSDQYGELFKQAKDKTEKIIDVLNQGDEVYLIKLSDLPNATIDPATHDFSALRTLIRESNITSVTRSIDEAARTAERLLAKSKNANKEVYIISDMQRTLFTSTTKDSADNTNSPNRFFLVEVGTKEIDNIGIDSVEVLNKILEVGKPVELSAIIRNFTPTPVSNYVVSGYLENARAAQQSVRIDPWGTATVILKVIPKHAGLIKGYVETENDALEQDNRRYFTLSIPERINVALVADNPGDAHFPALALQAGRADSLQSLVNVQQVTSDKFPTVDLKRTDVLIIMNTKGISSIGFKSIKEFVEHGGGVIIFPSSAFQQGEFNAEFLPSLAVPSVAGVTGNTNANSSVSFQKIDLDHPLFNTIFDKTLPGFNGDKRTIESPAILRSLQRQVGVNSHVIISQTDGMSFLSEHTLGSGKILFYSVSPVLSWSDFPLKGIFVPLIYRSVLYLGAHPAVNQSYLTGQDAIISIEPTEVTGETKYTLYSPDGTQELMVPTNENKLKEITSEGSPRNLLPIGSLTFVKPHVIVPGFYDLKSGSVLLSVFDVNIDSRESDTRKMSLGAMEEFWKKKGIEPKIIPSVDQAAAIQTTVLQSRFGVELWKYLLALCLLLVIIEMIIAHDSREKEKAPA
ncbi:MAG: BatA domain-containing protein [Bacteroidota bacterium]